MRNYKVDVNRLYPIVLGYAGETNVQTVTFDFSVWQVAYGTGLLSIFVKRVSDTNPYPVDLVVEDHEATWTVTNADTAYEGTGEIQLVYTVDGAIKKSATTEFKVQKSLVATTVEPPDPYVTWFEQVLDAKQYVMENIGTAVDSAETASGAARTATTQAEIAEGHADDAEASASTASSAAGRAEQAEGSVTATAQVVAENARTASENATTAVNAKNDAVSARNMAESYRDSAEGYASAAATSAADAENRVYGVGLSLAVSDNIATLTY